MTDTTCNISRRRPRFVRATPPPFRLAEGDVEIISLFVRHRFLRSTHIAVLCGRSLDRTNDRLLRLFHGGYVDRPTPQLDRFQVSGSEPMVYELAKRGVELLHERGLRSIHSSSHRRGSCVRRFINHELNVADFYVALHLAASRRADVALISDQQELLGRGANAEPSGQWPSLGGGDASVVPDFIFGLRFPDGSRRCFFAEIDRGTMPITRSSSGSSIEGKFRAYMQAYLERYHEKNFGWKTFRTLIVTTSSKRASAMRESLRRASKTQDGAKHLFLFGTFAHVLKNPLDDVWLDVEERLACLV